MLEIIALIVACAVAIATTSYALKMRKELNQVWDRVAVNDIHIQKLQEKNGLEIEPTSSSEKVKQLLKRFTQKT